MCDAAKEVGFGFLNNNLICHVWQRSIGTIRAKGVAAQQPAGHVSSSLSLCSVPPHHVPAAPADCDEQRNVGRGFSSIQNYIEATDWHAMVGKNVAAVSSSLMCPKGAWDVVLLGLTLQVTETMSRFHWAAEIHKGGDNLPTLDLIWSARSPAYVVMQFFSAALSGRHPSVSLLCYQSGVLDTQSLHRSSLERVEDIRTVFVLSSSWTYIRHWLRHLRTKGLCAVADKRRPLIERRNIAQAAVQGCKNCRWRGAEQKVVASVSSPEQLFEGRWQRLLLHRARLRTEANYECGLLRGENKRTLRAAVRNRSGCT